MLRTPPALAAALLLAATVPATAQLPDTFRWTNTIRDGGGLQQGDATTLTWGFIADGTETPETTTNQMGQTVARRSDLIAFLDANVGDADINNSTNVLSQKDWFGAFESYHERYAAISGLSYEYTANDDGVRLNGSSAGNGALDGSGNIVRPDVRIGGTFVDGQDGRNTLAYNYFPNGGDMIIDTSNVDFYGNGANDELRLRNVLAHEHGHGIGQPHYQSGDFRGLMEPTIDLSFDGPQIVDILQTQRGYGDVLEKLGGNDTAGAANVVNLADFTSVDEMVAVGLDAANLVVGAGDTDFFSIDGLTDTDFWEFTLDAAGTVNLLLEPLGLTLNVGPQGGSRTDVNLSERTDLRLALFGADGTTLLELSDGGFAGDSEEITRLLDAGTYFARVDAAPLAADAAQFYGLTVDFSPAAVPEPGSWALVLLAAGGAAARRRKKRGPAAAAA